MKKRFFLRLVAVLVLSALAIWAYRSASHAWNTRALSGEITDAPDQNDARKVGTFEFSWDSEAQEFLIQRQHGDEKSDVFSNIPGEAFLVVGTGEATVTESRGLFRLVDSRNEWTDAQSIDPFAQEGDGLRVDGDASGIAYRATFTLLDEYTIEFQIDVDDPEVNRIWLTVASDPDEKFFGFGEQFSFFEFSGKRVPILTSEQGIGRGVQPITAGANLLAGAGGDWTTSYAPVPHFISNRMRSIMLDNTEYSVFDLRDPGRIQIEVHANQMRGCIYSGQTPAEIIGAHARHTGLMRPLPDWAIDGAIAGMQGGTEMVREVWGQLQAHDTPISAFWLQDWQGQRKTAFGKQLWWNWELDDERYAGWDAMRAEMAEDDIRLMGYINCFLVDIEGRTDHVRNLFVEAEARDFLLRDEGGEVILIPNTDFSAAMLDLSNEEARDWIKQVIKDELIGVGLSGWMADFGEALPWHSKPKNGDAAEWHNRYPVEWAKANREAIEEAGLGEEAVFFSRSGYTESPRYSTLFWLGDQLVSWDEHDGIKTAVTGLLTSGLSGYVFNHSDIGGYTTVTNPLRDYHRSKELLLRWMELNAFTTIYRTHEGNDPEKNVQFYTDDETLAHFARFAKIYQAWGFYRKALVEEASVTGLPVVRHPFIHYPDDPAIWDLNYEEFLVGEEILVAPVLDPGVDTVRAYLPQGRWEHLWSGEEYGSDDAGSWVEVSAPMGQPGVFLKAGSAVGLRFKENLEAAGLFKSVL